MREVKKADLEALLPGARLRRAVAVAQMHLGGLSTESIEHVCSALGLDPVVEAERLERLTDEASAFAQERWRRIVAQQRATRRQRSGVA
jgi:hypothetical protein